MENPITTGATPAPENIQPTAGTPNPFKKVILALVSLLVVGGVGATVYLNMGTPAQGDPNEPPPSLSVGGGGIKGSFTGESTQGFLQYEAKDITDFDSTKAALVAKFGTPGVVKGNALTNYMSVNADGMTMADVVNNYNPKAVGNRALFIMYSAGQGGLSKGFHTYPAGPFGTATTEIKKDDLSKVPLARNSGVVILSRSDTEIYGVLDPATAPSGSYTGPFLPDDKGGWVLVSGNGRLSDLIGASKDRIISAWTLKDATTFEKVDMNTYSFSTYHMAWLNLSPKSSISDTTAIAPKITKVEPATAVQGQKAVTFTITGTDLGGAQVSFNPPADFQNLTGLVVDTTKTSVKFVADIADGATADLKEIKVTTTAGSVTDKSFKVTAKEVVNPLVGQTVLAHYNFPGTLATVQWFEAKVTAVKNNKFSYTFVNKIVSSIDGKAFDIDPKVTPGASISDDYETNIAVPADAPYLEGENDLYVIVKYKTTGGYWNAILNSKNTDGTYNITYLNDKNMDNVPLSKVYKVLGAKIHIAPLASTNAAGAPTITDLSVKEGVTGESVKLDITGTNLSTATALSLGGLEIGGTPLSNLTATKAHAEFFINTSIPLGPQFLIITNPSGTGKFGFKINAAPLKPVITSLSVNETTIGSLASITITGDNISNITELRIGNVVAQTAFDNVAGGKKLATFTVLDTLPVGIQDLVVVSPAGTSAPVKFTVKAKADPCARMTGIALTACLIKNTNITPSLEKISAKTISDKPRAIAFTIPTDKQTFSVDELKKNGLTFTATDPNVQSFSKDVNGKYYMNYKWNLSNKVEGRNSFSWSAGWVYDESKLLISSPSCITEFEGLTDKYMTCPKGTIPASAFATITAGNYILTGEVGDGQNGNSTSVEITVTGGAAEPVASTGLKAGSKVLALWNNHGKIVSPNRWYTADIAKVNTSVVWGFNVTTYDVNYTDGSGDNGTFLPPESIVDLSKPINSDAGLKVAQIVVAKSPSKNEWYNAIVVSESSPWTLTLLNDTSEMINLDVKNTYLTLGGYKEMGNFLGDMGLSSSISLKTTDDAPSAITFTSPTANQSFAADTLKASGLSFEATDSNAKSYNVAAGKYYMNYKWTLNKGDVKVWGSEWTSSFPTSAKTCDIARDDGVHIWTCPSGTIPASAFANVASGTYTLVGDVGDGQNGASSSVTFTVTGGAAAISGVEADLANLKVIIDKPQINLTTGDVDGITFWIDRSGLKSTEYGSGGKKLDFNLTRNGTQVLPVEIDPVGTYPRSFQYLDAIYVRNAGGNVCIRWKTSGDSTCTVNTKNIPFLPAELSLISGFTDVYAVKTQFLKIPYLETKKAQNYVFTFTLDGKTVYTQNYTYQRGEPDFKISGFTPSIMKYDAAIKGYVSSAPKDEFGWAKTCNTNYTTKVETCYQETYDMPNTFYEQRVKITNNSETGFVLPYQLADYTIRLYAPGANPDDKASAIMTLPAADIATYTSPGTNLPGPKQTVILRIPYDKLKSTAGIVKLWHKVGGEEVISGSGN